MFDKKELQDVKDLIKDFKPQLGFFEKSILLPEVVGRLDYIRSIFLHFKAISQDAGVAVHIDAALRKIVHQTVYNPKLPEPKIGEQYLAQVGAMLDDQYIQPIGALLQKYPIQGLKDGDVENATAFLNESKLLFDSIISVKDKAFLYSLRTFVNVKNLQTGEVMLGPPTEISLILMPFETRLGELLNVAQTTSESIKLWSEQIHQQQKKHIDLIVHMSQIKVAKEQTAATRKGIVFQVAVIFFTVLLVILSQPINTYIQQKVLESAFDSKSGEAAACKLDTQKQVDLLQSAKSETEARLNACLQRVKGKTDK